MKKYVFIATKTAPYFSEIEVEVPDGGFVFERKKVRALHESFLALYPFDSVLEISSKSDSPDGAELSALNLLTEIPSLSKIVSVENAYRGSKVFTEGGPYSDLYDANPKEIKKDDRTRKSGEVTHYVFDGKEYPKQPRTAFYNWLYINAVLRDEKKLETLLKYKAFSRYEYNSDKSQHCQGKAAAMCAGLAAAGKLDCVKDFSDFIKEVYG